jgi:DNA polymerase delta subunit 1
MASSGKRARLAPQLVKAPFGPVDPPVDLEAAKKGWGRPDVPQINQQQDAMTFQQVEVDQYYSQPDSRFHPPGTRGEQPVIRLFGVTDNGNSVAVHVHGFQPYFYVPASKYALDDLALFSRELEKEVQKRVKGMGGDQSKCVANVEIQKKQSMMHFQREEPQPFLKVTLTCPHMVTKTRQIFHDLGTQTYESNVQFPLRFMIDHDIGGGQWVSVKAGKYQLRERNTVTRCQIELDCHHECIEAHSPLEGDWGRIAPMRVLSFDIECYAKKGFPEPEKDPIITIATTVTVQGEAHPTISNVMQLGSCDPIAGNEVQAFENESDLLRAWRELVTESDPDVITGYNINNFDIPYILDRATALKMDDFPFLSRVRASRTKTKNTTFSSKAQGTRESKEVEGCEGRVIFDMMQAIQRDQKLSSYSLNSVASEFLGDQKEDVQYNMISVLQEGNAESRRKLASYCLKDALLPQQLFDKLMYMYNYVEMARVTGVPISFLLGRGQMIKVMSQLMRKGRQQDLVLPNRERTADAGQLGGNEYEGATVLDAISGFYQDPIATLDFASLYPSIMQAHNLCYTTLVRKEDIQHLSEDEYSTTPKNHVFVKPSVRKGVLPAILDELLNARKRAKADLKKATDPLERAVLDGRQLALKVSANSVYGFTGATVGQMPCLEISESVTSYGRQMIDHTKAMVERDYSIANGFKYDAKVVYGDTDSVFVNFGPWPVAEAMKIGEEASERVSKTFLAPIKLEFEKVYCPLLLITKKRYAGLKYLDPDKPPKMDTTGVETVRRDNCEFVRQTMTVALDLILLEGKTKEAEEYVKFRVSQLLQDKLDLSQLIVTKGYTKKAEDYENKQGHIELAMKMMKRDPLTAPTVGDRIPYVCPSLMSWPLVFLMCDERVCVVLAGDRARSERGQPLR